MSNKSISYVDFRDLIMDEAEYIKDFPNDEQAWDRLRALFTAFCIAFELGVDTHECDWLLYDIHGKVMDASEKYHDADAFEEFMLKYLV